MSELTQVELKAEVVYCQASGNFTRNGEVIGNLDSYGYVQIFVKGKLRLAHRLAFLYMTGSMPISEVDHVDNCPANNAWSNLREATRSQNCMNRKVPKHSSSGVKGVGWHKATQQYRARITVNKVRIELGGFDTLEAATEARRKAAANLHGTFARS